MQKEDLHLKLAKCAFDQTEVEYLGLIVKDREVLMDPIKLRAVEQWEPSMSVKAVRSFIRFCNFYRKFIPNFSTLAQPLHNLTKKGVTFWWGKEQDDAFIKLKETFLSAPVIKMPDTTKPFFIMTDVKDARPTRTYSSCFLDGRYSRRDRLPSNRRSRRVYDS